MSHNTTLIEHFYQSLEVIPQNEVILRNEDPFQGKYSRSLIQAGGEMCGHWQFCEIVTITLWSQGMVVGLPAAVI